MKSPQESHAPDVVAELNTALKDHYVIERELGRGGMATVYLANDVKHDRFVALKTLRPEIALALGRERFLREIKLAARLQHPNILGVYDSGEANGTLYYIMPYVEGESLRDRLEREPQLPLEEALQIAREVAEALSYAHSHDVVHRDIKPENIMLSGGHAMVADFGIARAISAAGGDKLTETGLAIGTPAYMSPEQATGSPVDRRSDIYSLGCVLYETLAGQPPFTGPTAQAIMARHSLDSVPRLKIVRETIPDALEEVITRSLAKVPADRHQTASQFAEAMMSAATGRVSRVTFESLRRPGRAWRRVTAGIAAGIVAIAGVWWFGVRPSRGADLSAASLDRKRVAVAYFADYSPDSSLRHVADGLTEGVISALEQVRGLNVVSRNGVAPFRGTTVTRDSVARALGAGSLIEGAVDQVPGGVRVNVRLVDGSSDADLERASFTFPAGGILAANDSVVQEVARWLRVRLGDEVQLRERRAATASEDAWTLVLRAEKARKDADAAARQDRNAALALLARADTLLLTASAADRRWTEPLILRGWVAQDAARQIADREGKTAALLRALPDAERAVTMDPDNARALEVRGTLRYRLWRQEATLPGISLDSLARAARADLEAALRFDNSLASAHATFSFLLHDQKDIVSSVLEARTAYTEDAYLRFADVILERLFHGSYNVSGFSQARQWCDEGGRRFPRDFRFVDCQLRMLIAPDAKPDINGAWRLAARADSLAPDARREFYRRRSQMLVAAVIAKAEKRDSALHVSAAARADATIDATQDLVAYEALVLTFLGERDRAVTLLKQYVAANPGHSFQVGGDVHWWWRDLRNHPDFRQVLATAH